MINNNFQEDHGRGITDFLEFQFTNHNYDPYYNHHDHILNDGNNDPVLVTKKSQKGFAKTIDPTLTKTRDLTNEDIDTYI